MRIVPAGDRDAVIAALFESGAGGLQEDGAALVTLFPESADLDSIRRSVLKADPAAEIETGIPAAVPDPLKHADVRAHRVLDLVVSPPWLAAHYPPGQTIVIEPAMAFGTGEHPTTRGVMRLMQGVGVMRPGDVVADLGAGSAVLSIAAAKLGAARVAAIELDPDAISNAEENVVANGVSQQVKVIEGDAGVILPLVAPVRLILANIISGALVRLLPEMRTALAPGGMAILSGILLEERWSMSAALRDASWEIRAEDSEDVWWSVLVVPA